MNDCIIWTGARSGLYGSMGARSRPHREIYELARGPIPVGYALHHLCENKLCINVTHLVSVSPAEHGRHHRRAVCYRGHALTDDNIYVRPDNGKRRCLTCAIEYGRSRPPRPKVLMTCVVCGVQQMRRPNARFCSSRCYERIRIRRVAA